MTKLTDVPGFRVGHAQRHGDGWLTGTTVVLAPPGGAVAAVDVRGGGPGTRETDALDPRNLVERVDAVVLTGGSAFGLAAADGVMAWLEEQRRGVPVGPLPGQVVPVVPAACIFDLGRGGDWRARPGAVLGGEAVVDALSGRSGVLEGCVGAGTGAVAGGMKGGVGTASLRTPGGATVGATVVVNAAGDVVDPATGLLYGDLFAGRPVLPPPAEAHARARERLAEARAETRRRQAGAEEPLHTTLAVVATDAALTPAQAQKLAGTAHDGLARAIRPVHLLTDGDTVFALASGPVRLPEAPVERLQEQNALLAAAADAVTEAIVRAVRAATGVETPGGVFPSWQDLYGAGAAE
ncbi:P1 family peptidase [Streptacidiphilus monticola]|uniref:P1 family peptidase n=1 Tax=Streptacidiphilus monticola TaxID=2161674 RepID=A0ABW1G3Q8_9ACTN